MTFGQRLKELRIKRGFTQEDLEAKLGVQRNNFSHYERGTSNPPLDVLVKIADLFHVSTDYLLGREKECINPNQMDDVKQILDELIELSDFIPKYCKTVNRLQTIVNK